MTQVSNRESLMYDFATRLLKATKGCRTDMHEPDEEGIIAKLSGNHLDNAGGDDPTFNEFIVTLKRGEMIDHFNVATLIALARIGATALETAADLLDI